MALSIELIVIIAAAAVLAIVVFFELRYMRSRRREKVETALLRDDAYNALITTRAVSRALKEKERDTADADRLIMEAERAYQRQDYASCKDLADKARVTLKGAKVKEELQTFEDIASAPAPEAESTIPFQETKKLPENYLESKFMIESARLCILSAVEKCLDTKDAEAQLEEAKGLFEKAEYTGALRCALRAKRCAEGQKVDPPARPEPAKVAEKTEKVEEKAPGIAECPGCGTKVGPEDRFCRRCGAKIRILKCPSCSAEADEEDRFCGKCGTKLRE